MAAPPFDYDAPDPGATGGWGPEITATRDNIINLMIFAAASGSRLPDWDTAFTYTTGNLTQVEMTYQSDTLVKMRWVYTYASGKISTEKWYFDKGLGGGMELLFGGTLTNTYSGDELSSIAAT
jgi:hypothetical protein